MSEISKALPVAGSVASTTTAAALPSLESYRAIQELLLQAHPDNDDNILVGNAESQSIVIQPGETFGIKLSEPGSLFHKSASGSQTLGYLGRD